MATTRGVRMEEETIVQLQRLCKVRSKTQAEYLKDIIGWAYQKARQDPQYGPWLIAIEEMEKAAEKVTGPEKKSRGAVIRLDAKEARDLRRKAYEETGDPGNAAQLAKEVIREKLLKDGEG